jgi:methylene-tetrahydromethanopterin dehydrogenase
LIADDDQRSAKRFCERYKADVEWVSAQTDEEKDKEIQDTEVIICAARAGVRILERSLVNAKNLVVVADTNAVPPSGVFGIGLNDLGAVVQNGDRSFLSIGPLAIGNLKYKTQFGLFELIQTSNKVTFIDFPDAYAFALSILEQQAIKLDKAV